MEQLDEDYLISLFLQYFNIDGTLGFLLGNLAPITYQNDDNVEIIENNGFLEMDNFSLFIDL